MHHASRRSIVKAAALLPIAAIAFTSGVHAQTAMHGHAQPMKNRLVIQVTDNDPARWNMVLNNTKNAQDDVGGPDKIDIEIVAYGPGINMLKADSPVGARISELVKSGVKVVGCENTLRNFKLEKSEMLASIGYVPAGITELMKKQQEGWSYVRP